jgi:plasmid stability protein
MTITLSIKKVPDQLAQRLKARAARNHRSLQGELLAIIEQAEPPRRSIDDISAMVDRLGIRTLSDSASIVREARDGRPRR